MTETYRPQPGDQVRVRRFEQPSLEPGDPDRKLVMELTGTVTSAHRNNVMELDPASVVVRDGDDGPPGVSALVNLGYTFLGQGTRDARGRCWYLVTEVTRLGTAEDQLAMAKDEYDRLARLWGDAQQVADAAREARDRAGLRLEGAEAAGLRPADRGGGVTAWPAGRATG